MRLFFIVRLSSGVLADIPHCVSDMLGCFDDDIALMEEKFPDKALGQGKASLLILLAVIGTDQNKVLYQKNLGIHCRKPAV